jgi:hypothetical protein
MFKEFTMSQYITGPVRQKDEEFAVYKLRLKTEKALLKLYLKGRRIR